MIKSLDLNNEPLSRLATSRYLKTECCYQEKLDIWAIAAANGSVCLAAENVGAKFFCKGKCQKPLHLELLPTLFPR